MEHSRARQNNEMDSDNSILQRIMHLKELKMIGTRQIKRSCKATDNWKIWNTDNTLHIDCHRLLLFDEDEYFLCLVKFLLGEEWSDVNQECWLRSSRESLSSELRFRHSFIRALAAETSILTFLCNVKWSLWRQVLREDSSYALPLKLSSEKVLAVEISHLLSNSFWTWILLEQCPWCWRMEDHPGASRRGSLRDSRPWRPLLCTHPAPATPGEHRDECPEINIKSQIVFIWFRYSWNGNWKIGSSDVWFLWTESLIKTWEQ